MPKRQVRGFREVYIHSYLRNASHGALRQARNVDTKANFAFGEQEQLLYVMTSMLFSALCLEAYLNLIGKRKVKYWDILEKALNFREKLELIAAEVGYKLNLGGPPFQTFSDLKKLRDMVVHGKFERHDIDETIDVPAKVIELKKLVDADMEASKEYLAKMSEDLKTDSDSYLSMMPSTKQMEEQHRRQRELWQEYNKMLGLEEWEEMCNLENAERFFQDVNEMISLLHRSAGYADPWQSYKAEIKLDDDQTTEGQRNTEN